MDIEKRLPKNDISKFLDIIFVASLLTKVAESYYYSQCCIIPAKTVSA